MEALLAAGVNYNIQDTVCTIPLLPRWRPSAHLAPADGVWGACVGCMQDGKTALYMSCEKGHTTIAIALLASGADVNMPAEVCIPTLKPLALSPQFARPSDG